MPKIKISGQIGPNNNSFWFRFFGIDYTCPADVERVIEEAKGERIDVYINSPGGEIGAGSAIYTMLRQYGNVSIHIMGAAHSAASIIAMSGRSEMSPTALMMVHCVSTCGCGNHREFEHQAEVLRTADQALCSAYVDKTGMTEEEALQMMENETWFTAQQALERGLIDAIMFQDPETVMTNVSTGNYTAPTQEQLDQVTALMAKGYQTIEDVPASEEQAITEAGQLTQASESDKEKALANLTLIELANKSITIG